MTSLNQFDIKDEPSFVEFIIVIFQLVQVNGIHTRHKDHIPSYWFHIHLSQPTDASRHSQLWYVSIRDGYAVGLLNGGLPIIGTGPRAADHENHKKETGKNVLTCICWYRIRNNRLNG